MALRIRKVASFETPKTQTEALHMQSKGKPKIEDVESLGEAPNDIDWKLIRAV